MRFPLQNEWSFFVIYPMYANYCEEAYQRFGQFSDVCSFWSYYLHFLKPSDVFATRERARMLVDNRSIEGFGMFRTSIKPQWEDEANANGGHWEITGFGGLESVDEAWETLVLLCVGHTITEGDYAAGVRVVDKSKRSGVQYRLELWLTTKDPKVVEESRQKMQAEVAGIDQLNLVFKTHS